MLKRLVVILVLVTVLWGIAYTLSPEVEPRQVVAGYDGCFDSEQAGVGPLLVYHCSYPEFTHIFIGRLMVEYSPHWDEGYAALGVSYEGLWGGDVFYGREYAHIWIVSLRPDQWGRTGLIVREYYIRYFPPAISSTPLVCVKNMEDEVVGPGELLVTAETDAGQPFCDYIFEFQRLGDLCILKATCERKLGEKYTISHLDSGGNTSVIGWDKAGVYAITFRSADGEVLCSYNLVYQPDLGNIARCIVPASYVEESKREIINP